MDENEFELDGVIFKAVDEPADGYPCAGCFFDFCEPDGPSGAPDCRGRFRRDGRSVIFVEKQP